MSDKIIHGNAHFNYTSFEQIVMKQYFVNFSINEKIYYKTQIVGMGKLGRSMCRYMHFISLASFAWAPARLGVKSIAPFSSQVRGTIFVDKD